MDARYEEKLALRASKAVEVTEHEPIQAHSNVYNPGDLQARFRAKMALRGGVEMTPDPAMVSPVDKALAAAEGQIERQTSELESLRKALRSKGGGAELEAAKVENEKLREANRAGEAEMGKLVKALDDAGAEIDRLRAELQAAKGESENAKAAAAKAEGELEQLTKPAPVVDASKVETKPDAAKQKRG